MLPLRRQKYTPPLFQGGDPRSGLVSQRCTDYVFVPFVQFPASRQQPKDLPPKTAGGERVRGMKYTYPSAVR